MIIPIEQLKRAAAMVPRSTLETLAAGVAFALYADNFDAPDGSPVHLDTDNRWTASTVAEVAQVFSESGLLLPEIPTSRADPDGRGPGLQRDGDGCLPDPAERFAECERLRLSAGAPDLAAALDEMVFAFEGFAGLDDFHRATLSKARAALAAQAAR